MVVDELWTNFLSNIKKEIQASSYNLWFDKLKLVNVEQDKMTIQVPMDLHKKMLGENYYSLIEETLFNLSGINYDIHFVLESELPKQEKI